MVPFERRSSEVHGGRRRNTRPQPSQQHQLRPPSIHLNPCSRQFPNAASFMQTYILRWMAQLLSVTAQLLSVTSSAQLLLPDTAGRRSVRKSTGTIAPRHPSRQVNTKHFANFTKDICRTCLWLAPCFCRPTSTNNESIRTNQFVQLHF